MAFVHQFSNWYQKHVRTASQVEYIAELDGKSDAYLMKYHGIKRQGIIPYVFAGRFI